MNLKNLSKIEKLALLRKLKEKAAIIKLAESDYKPNAGQLPVHQCEKTIRAVFSGNGSGKTTLAVMEAMWRAIGYNPILKKFTKVPAHIAVVLDRPEKVEERWLPEIHKWFSVIYEARKNGKAHINELRFENGSIIKFYSHSQDPLTFEGIEIDLAIFDEPPPRSIFVALRRGGRKKNSNAKYLIVGTPLACPWLREEIYEPWANGEADDIECFRFKTDVNKDNIDWEYTLKFFETLTPTEQRIRREGDFFDLTGLALAPLFDTKVHVRTNLERDWKSEWPCVIGVDPHPEKSHVAVLMGVAPDGKRYVLRELTSKSVPRDFARELKAWSQGFNVVTVISDSLGSTAYTGGEGNKSFIDILREEGLPIRPTTKQDKNEQNWIMKIQQLLARDDNGLPGLYIDATCKGLINDIKSVKWKQVKSEVDLYYPKLDMKNTDFLSALKYALASNLSFKSYNRTAPVHVSPRPWMNRLSAQRAKVRYALRNMIRDIRRK